MLFVDDIVLLDQLKDGMNMKLEKWWGASESNGFKIMRTKIEYMNCNFSRDVHRVEMPMRNSNTLTWYICKDGEIKIDVEHMIRAGWLKWTLAFEIFCDWCILAKIEGKILYGNNYTNYDLWSRILASWTQHLHKWVWQRCGCWDTVR